MKETKIPRSRAPQPVVLAGCGPAARHAYLKALRELQQTGAIEVRAIIDPYKPARDRCLEIFPHAQAFPSLDALEAPADALILIASAARFHAAQAIAALKRGWHVICAMPFTTTAHEGALVIATAQRYDRLLAVDLSQRVFPATRYARTLCQDHLLGPALSFQIYAGTPPPLLEANEPVPARFETPGGVLAELGADVFDVLTWCLGSASIISYADDAMGGVEANAAIELTFNDSVRGSVHLSRDWPREQAYTFVFERGILRWNPAQANRLALQLASAPAAIDGELILPLSLLHAQRTTPLLAFADEAAIAQLENMIAAIAGREPLRSPATEAMHSLPLIEECYARRTALAQPWLTQNEAAHARMLSPPPALRRA